MGVTWIKRLENRSRSPITLLNIENTGTRGHNIVVPAGTTIMVDMAIPWAGAQADFAGHHLEIVVGGVTRYWIWQANHADGDFIRFSTDGAWHDKGEHAHGYAGSATNIFEAVGGVISGDFEDLAQLYLAERALIVLDSHFETIPIGAKPALPNTTIKLLENRTSSAVSIFNTESQQTVTIGPGGTISLSMIVPWAAAQTDFSTHHLRVTVGGVPRFWIWQADHRNDGDYVRFSTNGAWSPLANRAKGFDGTGVCPADLVFTGDRRIIVSDTRFELMPHPLLLDDLIALAKEFIHLGHKAGELSQNPVTTLVPKRSAVAFSMAGSSSDAFLAGRSNARFLYKDSGKRYEFTVSADGKVTAIHPDGTRTLLDKARSFNVFRKGGPVTTAPKFDLIAANGSRVFAKVEGADDFYFASMDHLFIKPSQLNPNIEVSVPSTYFKLDPEFGNGGNPADLMVTTEGVETDHPASERFPIFRRVMKHQLNDMMLADIRIREWQQLDCRPPQDVLTIAIRDLLLKYQPLFLAMKGTASGSAAFMLLSQLPFFIDIKDRLTQILTNPSLAGAPPAGTPTYTPITYELPDGSPLAPPAIKFQKVLDIGVGHVHYHQQYQRITGGEMQAMISVPIYAEIYRFFNGALQDGDGYCDGTANYYALVKHDSDIQPYSLIFLDEQFMFSKRWRLLAPNGFQDDKGVMFSLVPDLGQPEYRWDNTKFWCPFKSKHINDATRLAVSTQVLLVNGYDPDAKVWRIYGTNFSWGTMDRTWRWRSLPPNVEPVPLLPPAPGDPVPATDETIDVSNKQKETIYHRTIHLRDDMTMHMKGMGKAGGSGSEAVEGRWYQRYLPADNNLIPANGVAGQMPFPGYEHKWKFLPERVFRLADNFTFFGVYDEVDGRTQYYDVTPATATDAAKLEAIAAAPPRPEPWIDDTRQLYVSQWKFRWSNPDLPGADPLDVPSLFNPDTRLRLVKKGTRWIAMLWDKRDDDMTQFERLPRLVTLKRTTPTGTDTVQVKIGTRHTVMQPPVVQNAYFWLEANGVAGIGFESVGTGSDALRENVAKVRMASLEADPVDTTRVARVNPLFDRVTEGNFNLVAPGVFEYRWTPAAADLTALQQQANLNGEMQKGTSIWFEDILGNVAPPQRLCWGRSGTAKGTATPSMIPLGVPTQVTVRATDFRTGDPLTKGGDVMVDGQKVGKMDVPFTFTFNTRIVQEWDPELKKMITTDVINPVITVKPADYPETEVPVTFFTAKLDVRMEPASVPIGPAVQVVVRAEDSTTKTPVAGRVMIAGTDVGPTNVPFNFAFGPTMTSGGVNATGYPGKGFLIGLFTPEMQLSVSSPIWTGRPVEVIVRAVDKRTGALVNGRVKLNGVDVGATNTPFMYTFGVTPLVGVVSAQFYADAAIVWPPLSVSTMRTSIKPYPAPMNRTIQCTISAVNEQTGALVAGRVRIDGTDVGATNTPITTIFRTRKVGAEAEIFGPEVWVTALGYNNTPVDVGFG